MRDEHSLIIRKSDLPQVRYCYHCYEWIAGGEWETNGPAFFQAVYGEIEDLCAQARAVRAGDEDALASQRLRIEEKLRKAYVAEEVKHVICLLSTRRHTALGESGHPILVAEVCRPLPRPPRADGGRRGSARDEHAANDCPAFSCPVPACTQLDLAQHVDTGVLGQHLESGGSERRRLMATTGGHVDQGGPKHLMIAL